ncbi:MAG: hypothetical protein IPH28_25330 [Cytophagaceae bacterium]|nr:hypothetical protein [Cytophagaceae bacterium]
MPLDSRQFVAVGGDGTVNEVASALQRPKEAPFIIPQIFVENGSGTGHWEFLMNWEKALQQAIQGTKDLLM